MKKMNRQDTKEPDRPMNYNRLELKTQFQSVTIQHHHSQSHNSCNWLIL